MDKCNKSDNKTEEQNDDSFNTSDIVSDDTEETLYSDTEDDNNAINLTISDDQATQISGFANAFFETQAKFQEVTKKKKEGESVKGELLDGVSTGMSKMMKSVRENGLKTSNDELCKNILYVKNNNLSLEKFDDIFKQKGEKILEYVAVFIMLMNYNDFCKNKLNITVDKADIEYMSEISKIIDTMNDKDNADELCKLLSKEQLDNIRQLTCKYEGLKSDNMCKTTLMSGFMGVFDEMFSKID